MKLEKTITRLSTGLPVTIVALGDSLTYGWMVQKGYLDYMQDMLSEKYPGSSCDIVNRGIPGDTAEGGLRRLREHVIEYAPHAVLVQFALNDAFCGYSPEQYERNIASIVHSLQQNTAADILLVTSISPGDARDDRLAESFYARLTAVAGQEHIPLARVHAYWKKKITGGMAHSDLLQADLVHPTTPGYRLMAEAIMEMF